MPMNRKSSIVTYFFSYEVRIVYAKKKTTKKIARQTQIRRRFSNKIHSITPFLLSVSNDQTSTPSIPKCLTHFYAFREVEEVAYESSLMPLICTENF